jgi:hypothetical protein
MTDEEKQTERANRLRDQMARIKSPATRASDRDKSLREQIADRANQFRSPHYPGNPARSGGGK